FFFQAEDGIRDRTVTGVQTCALPICQCHADACLRKGHARNAGNDARQVVRQEAWRLRHGRRRLDIVRLNREAVTYLRQLKHRSRSEESRVGEECRLWWWRWCVKGKCQ